MPPIAPKGSLGALPPHPSRSRPQAQPLPPESKENTSAESQASTVSTVSTTSDESNPDGQLKPNQVMPVSDAIGRVADLMFVS